MFKIHFDPKIGRFIIQVWVLKLFWVTVKSLNSDNSKTENLSFKTFEEAKGHVESIGLDKLYIDKSQNRFDEHMGVRVINHHGVREVIQHG